MTKITYIRIQAVAISLAVILMLLSLVIKLPTNLKGNFVLENAFWLFFIALIAEIIETVIVLGKFNKKEKE